MSPPKTPGEDGGGKPSLAEELAQLNAKRNANASDDEEEDTRTPAKHGR